MKTRGAYQLIVFLTVSTILISCSDHKGETTDLNTGSLDTNVTQDIELAQRRIVYQIPEMEDVVSHKGIIYHSKEGLDLKADIYVPPHIDKNTNLPFVILVNGYPDSGTQEAYGVHQKDFGLFISWAELIAASGMIAVTYETQWSHSETDSLISFLHKNAETYNIDINRMALFGLSANTLTALSLMQNDNYKIKCAILYYGILLTPDQKYFSEIDSAANQYGFYWSDLRDIKKIPAEIPLLIARAGKDKFPIVIKTTDYFVTESIKSNIQLTYINYPEGQHDFDILDDTKISRAIIKQTVDFMGIHLLSD